jgi:DNA-binding NarL/FixJ family response regulator
MHKEKKMHALIVDDHDFVCEGLKSTLLIHYNDIIISTASSGESAEKILASENIDIAILDLFMPGAGGGFNLIESVCDSFPQLPVVVLSASESHAHIRKCLDLGVLGFVTKSSPNGTLFGAIDRALLGKVSAPERLTQSVPEVSKVIDDVDDGADIESIKDIMTPRQRDILACITQGRSNKQVARQLNLSENTVKVHVPALLWGLGLNNRTQAAILGQKLGL